MSLDLEPEIELSLSLSATLSAAETRLLDQAHPQSFRVFEGLLRRMRVPLEQSEAGAASTTALRLCQRLYANARSFDALPFARANLVLVEHSKDVALLRRSHTACGLLLADTGDIASAIEHHTNALRLAAAADDAVEMSRIWNNIGLAFCVAGSFTLATACFRRVLALLHSETAPVFSRYTAYANIANCLFYTDVHDEGLQFTMLAVEEMTPAFAQQAPAAPSGALHRR